MYIINKTQKENKYYNVKEKISETSGDWQNSFFFASDSIKHIHNMRITTFILSSKFKYCIRKIKQTHKTIQPLRKISFQSRFITL